MTRSFAFLALVACAGEDVTLEAGIGEAAFAPAADGDDLPLVFGPQGSFHVWGALRATGVVPGDPADFAEKRNPKLTMVLEQGGEVIGGFVKLPRGLYPDGDAYVRFGETLVVGPVVDALLGTEADLVVAIEDAAGATAEARITGTFVLAE